MKHLGGDLHIKIVEKQNVLFFFLRTFSKSEIKFNRLIDWYSKVSTLEK